MGVCVGVCVCVHLFLCVCDFPHALGDNVLSLSENEVLSVLPAWKRWTDRVCTHNRGGECVRVCVCVYIYIYVPAFSLAGSCHWKRLHSKLS